MKVVRLVAAATLLAALLAVGVAMPPAACAAAGQGAARRVVLESLDVSDNIYLLRGGGINTLALVREDGVVLVDTLGAGWGPATRAALDNLTTAPVTMIINSHAHADHTGGNGEFPYVTEIVAHENAKRMMETMATFDGADARHLPNRTFSNTLTLLDGIDRIELHHFGPAHTDGDILVVFPEKGIAYLGDLFARTAVPSVDSAAGGSAAGFPAVLEGALEQLRFFTEFVRGREVRTFDRIVPGREAPPDLTPLLVWFTWADLERFAQFTREVADAAASTRDAGGSRGEAVSAAMVLADRYPGYGDIEHLGRFVGAVFDEAGDAGR